MLQREVLIQLLFCMTSNEAPNCSIPSFGEAHAQALAAEVDSPRDMEQSADSESSPCRCMFELVVELWLIDTSPKALLSRLIGSSFDDKVSTLTYVPEDCPCPPLKTPRCMCGIGVMPIQLVFVFGSLLANLSAF